jgi:transposase
MDLLSAPRSELIRIIYEQQDTITALETQIAEIKARINNQDPKQQNKPPSWVKSNIRSKKKGPRRKREQNFARKLDTPTKQIFHSFNVCPDCGEKLGKPAVSYTRQTIDIPPAKVEITEHVICKRWCFSCKKRVTPGVNLKDMVTGQQRIGIRLMSIITMLKEACRQPLQTIQSYLEIMHAFHLSQGAIINILHKTAERGRPTYNNLLKQIRESNLVFADETGGRENGRNGYNWSFSNNKIHFLLYRKSRGKQVVEEVLGTDFEGVLSTDFYAAYNTYSGFHQRCWVHLLGDISDLKDFYPDDKEVDKWAKQVHAIYEEAKAYPGPGDDLPSGVREQERISKQRYFEDKLRIVCTPWVKTDKPMSILASRIIKHLQELFVFVRFEGIPSDNNSAERILRHTVVKRKISGGTRSAKGSETNSILTSLFDTWKLQNKNPLVQCQLLLASCP